MKRIAVGMLWTFLLLWAGNYLSLYAGLSPVLTAASAVAAGSLIAIATIRVVRSRPPSRPTQAGSNPSATNDHLARA
jgi:hypothetical protein